ncbi:MAG: hypothetical protein IT385_21025 [Deltaproteobacteria bacterium]|nr:hypothetical protein [Deltaproteobacteria bacterium]
MRPTSLCALSLALTACFEAGPLEVRGALADGVTSDDSAAPAEVDVASDSADVEASDGLDPDVDAAPEVAPEVTATTASDVTDGGDAGDASADADAPGDADVEVRACLTHADCEGVPRTDLCLGPIRCVDYGCRPDPQGAATCVDPVGTPCTDNRCDPTTGACVIVPTCPCESSGALACGQTLQLSTNDPGAAARFEAYACGPPVGPWTQRTLDLAPPAGRVRIDLASAGASGFHVLAPSGDQCDPVAGCVAGATSRLYLDATGTPLVLAVEQTAQSELMTLSLTCGITAETECGDALDDDGDGQTDCVDPDCNGVGGCPLVLTSESGLCVGELDEDDDGQTDCADADCADDPACLETCEVTTVNVGCGFHQGAPTGGGKANATHYACTAAPAAGKEVVYRFRPSFTGTVQVAFSGAAGLALFLLVDTGRGCTPRDCVATSATGLVFQAVEGTTYYLAIDAPAGVTGNYDLQVTCSN